MKVVNDLSRTKRSAPASQVMKLRGPDMPMVVAGNKTDVEPALEREQTEALVSF